MDKNNKKRNAVEWAMHYRQIIILVVCCLVAFGIYSLPEMRKNEFPDFTIRQGVVVAVAPGYTAEDMMEKVTKPLEEYIFTYKEVRKEKTFSKSKDGIVYIQVQLNDELNNKDEFWSKFKHGISVFKALLPSGVLALQVMDDFGDTSALLITMESENKTYRELDTYMEQLQNRLRRISSVGRMSVSGLQKEQISIYIDNDRLSQYGLNEQTLALSLMQKGFVTSGGRIKTGNYVQPVYVSRSLNTVFDVQQQIVYTDPQGNNIRLKDIARVVKEYPETDSYITNNGHKCLLLSVEMKKGQNIVKMGEAVNETISTFQQELPEDVTIFRITDQSQVVDDSVKNFLRELVIAIVAVLKSEKSDSASLTDLQNELIPVAGGASYVPLRQIADVIPAWKESQIIRRNGICTLTIMAEVERGRNTMEAMSLVQQKMSSFHFSPGVSMNYGGDYEDSAEKMPPVMAGLMVAAVVIFFILVIHFHKVNIATLIFSNMTLCLFGTAVGILIQGVDFSITCVLGIVSLMGIIVRNGIIMIDYAEELRVTEGMSASDAIYHSARRRMRPIFLTSAAASMGVIPMILGKSGLWMPMGTVICYWTLITMVFLLTVLPCAYLLIFRGSSRKRLQAASLEKQ